VISCTCRYCRAPRRTLRRRNPKDYAALKIEARRLYQKETTNLSEIAQRVGVSWLTIKRWVKDLIPKPQQSSSTDLERLEKIVKARQVYLREGTIEAVKKAVGLDFYTITEILEDLLPERIIHTDQYRELYNKGWHDRQIAEYIGVTYTAVTAWRNRNDLPPNADRRIPAYKIKQMREFCRMGTQQTDIADLLNVSVDSVRKYCKGVEVIDFDLPRPKKLPRKKSDRPKWRQLARQIYLETKNVEETKRLLDALLTETTSRRSGIGSPTISKWVADLKSELDAQAQAEQDVQAQQARKMYLEAINSGIVAVIFS